MAEELQDSSAAEPPNLVPDEVCDQRRAEAHEERHSETQLTSMGERSRGYDEGCGRKWQPELLSQDRREKNDVTVPDEVLERMTHSWQRYLNSIPVTGD